MITPGDPAQNGDSSAGEPAFRTALSWGKHGACFHVDAVIDKALSVCRWDGRRCLRIWQVKSR